MAQRIEPYMRVRKLPACDLCYTRKVKCDRQQECGHCSAAKVECVRSRPWRVRRPRGSQSQLSSQAPRHGRNRPIEPTVINSTPVENNTSHTTEYPQPPPAVELSPPSTLGERWPLPMPPRAANSQDTGTWPAALSPGTSRQVDDARSLIAGELETSVPLSNDRRRILQSALSLVVKYVNASHQPDRSHGMCLGDGGAAQEEIPPELFYMMLRPSNQAKTIEHWPDHIPRKTLDKMCRALLSGNVTGQTALQHKLCVLAKAAIHINRWLRTCSDEALSESLLQSSRRYTAVGLRCLEQIDFMTSPTLLGLQSLLSGVVLVQLLGDSARAWMLTAFASRVLVCLGYHSLSAEMLGDDDLSLDVRHCICWCYYLDKTLSMVLVRPASLPDLRLDPATIVSASPSEPLGLEVKILLKLASVQEVSLLILIKDSRIDLPRAPEIISSLEVRLRTIWDEISEAREIWNAVPEIAIESDAVEFTYYCILTTVLRLKSSLLRDIPSREECLHYARKAIVSMRSLQSQVLSSNGFSMDVLFWTVFLNPLTPFFVVFCNVIAASDLGDLQLLQQITADLSRMKGRNHFIGNLYKFFSQFIELCPSTEAVELQKTLPNDEPVNGTSRSMNKSAQHQNHLDELHTLASKQSQGLPGEATPRGTADQALQSNIHPQPASHQHMPFDERAVHSQSEHVSMWDDGLMWELFNTQPSIEWCDQGFADSFAH